MPTPSSYRTPEPIDQVAEALGVGPDLDEILRAIRVLKRGPVDPIDDAEGAVAYVLGALELPKLAEEQTAGRVSLESSAGRFGIQRVEDGWVAMIDGRIADPEQFPQTIDAAIEGLFESWLSHAVVDAFEAYRESNPGPGGR